MLAGVGVHCVLIKIVKGRHHEKTNRVGQDNTCGALCRWSYLSAYDHLGNSERRCILKRTNKKQVRAEQGISLALLYAACLVPMLMLVALMVDFAGAAMMMHKVQTTTDAAAFAAAQAIDMEKFYAENKVELKPSLASGYAGSIASQMSGGTITIASVYTSKDKVWVVGTSNYKTWFAGIVGITEVPISVTSSAVPAWGIDEQGQ